MAVQANRFPAHSGAAQPCQAAAELFPRYLRFLAFASSLQAHILFISWVEIWAAEIWGLWTSASAQAWVAILFTFALGSSSRLLTLE